MRSTIVCGILHIPMEQIFMGIVSLYFLIKTIYFILQKVDKFERLAEELEWDWITGPEDENKKNGM